MNGQSTLAAMCGQLGVGGCYTAGLDTADRQAVQQSGATELVSHSSSSGSGCLTAHHSASVHWGHLYQTDSIPKSEGEKIGLCSLGHNLTAENRAYLIRLGHQSAPHVHSTAGGS